MSENYLRFWGVRGSYPAPFDSHCKVGGNTSCIEIRVGDTIRNLAGLFHGVNQIPGDRG